MTTLGLYGLLDKINEMESDTLTEGVTLSQLVALTVDKQKSAKALMLLQKLKANKLDQLSLDDKNAAILILQKLLPILLDSSVFSKIKSLVL